MKKVYEDVLRGLVTHSDNPYLYANSLIASGKYEEIELKQILCKLKDEGLIAYVCSEGVGEIMVTVEGKHYFDEENEEPMTLEQVIKSDIELCREHQKREGSQRLYTELIAKYSELIPNLENSIPSVPQAVSAGEEFDYRGELNAIAAKLEMYLYTHQKATVDRHVSRKQYDVFISHASKDKEEYVDQLAKVARRLGISIFYDTDVISWGDNWKEVILNGTAESEFAIIVISKNFFGREWTEKELSEFLSRQNESGQKVVLPLLLGITLDELKAKYPALGDIQCVSADRLDQQEIVILLAKELIKRYK